MKKWISLLLAITLMVTALPTVLASAEESTDKAFVIDGKLDEWYRNDDWAVENGCYRYFKGLDDTLLDVVSRDFNLGMGEMDLTEFYENVEVEIYVGYDDHYAYFYVDVTDPDISTGIINDKGEFSPNHQQIENIDFYVDTDILSCEGAFYQNEESIDDADTHFRMIAHNMEITDAQGSAAEGKYTLAQEDFHNPLEYFRSKVNVFPFQKFDENNQLIGYGCEARFPLGYYYDKDQACAIYYNIAVTNHKTDDDPLVCAITTGKRWWMAYDTGVTVFFDPDQPNPFFNQPNPDLTAAQAVDEQIAKLPKPEELELNDETAVVNARKAYDALTDAQKALVTRLAELTAAEGKIDELKKAQPQFTPGDVDGNGKINAVDALWVLQSAVGKRQLNELQTLAGDMDQNEKLDATDALAILKLAVSK